MSSSETKQTAAFTTLNRFTSMSANLKKLNNDLKRAFSQSAKDPGACTKLLSQAKVGHHSTRVLDK